MIYSESDLIIPALTLLLAHEPSGLATSELITQLEDVLDIDSEDLRILKNRNDTHFSQKVRNLVSHRTLVRKGLAAYANESGGPQTITEIGKKYLENNNDDFSYLIASGFSEGERKDVIEKDFKDLIIEEGFLVSVTKKEKRKRSKQLTAIARKHYAKAGKMYCVGCNFNFDDFYGETARDYIEIHHVKPIFTYEADDTSKPLVAALENVRPLCSNCHRMVHRGGKQVLSIDELQQLVSSHGIFKITA